MNYRHHFHAGNFADVMKHALLVQLLRALQQKEKGFLYLDTHAGRGRYDLSLAEQGDTLKRAPEYPAGIGRLWKRDDLPPPLRDYVELVQRFDRQSGNLEDALRFYPGSPSIARLVLRPQDRLALYEKHPAESAALAEEFRSVQTADGYIALRAMLPPPERRALVLIDPPFEAQNEFAQIAAALREGLKRFPGGVFAVWYPLTERARVDAFFSELRLLLPPPTLIAELAIAGEQAAIKMRGCGLVIINPPWQFEHAAKAMLDFLAEALAQAPGASGRVDWLVAE